MRSTSKPWLGSLIVIGGAATIASLLFYRKVAKTAGDKLGVDDLVKTCEKAFAQLERRITDAA